MKTGNVKQVANFEQLVSTATALGAGYNPAKGSNKLPALNALLTEARQSLQTVKAAEIKYINATNARVKAFDGIDKYITRMVNALASTDASAQMIEDAMMIKQRTAGSKSARSVGSQKSQDNSGAATAMKDPPFTRSHGAKDYENKAMQFGKLLDLMVSEPSYTPNEPDLQIATLVAYHNGLVSHNREVINALTALKLARIARNKVIYADGIYMVAWSVKRYIKGAYGATSPQFASIGGLKFEKR